MGRRLDSREGPRPGGWAAPPSWSSLPSGFRLRVAHDRMAAKLIAHHRQQAIPKRVLHPAAEAGEQRLRDDRHGHRLVDRGLYRPAALTGVLDPALDARKLRILREAAGDEVQQPRAHHTAGTPGLGD